MARMTACFLQVSITDLPSLAILESFILTHIFLGHFPILLPYKNTELALAAVIQLGLVKLLTRCGILHTPQTRSQPNLMLKYLPESRLHR